MITIKDAIDIAYKVSDKTDKYWNFLVTVHFVIIGWLITSKVDLLLYHKIVLTLVYFNSILINYFALTKQYKMFYSIMTEVREQAKSDYFMTSEMNDLAKNLYFTKRMHIVNIIYIILILVVIYMVWR